MHDLVARLFPICRSQTGDGVRQSLVILSEYLPLQIQEVPTGTPVLDWEVPEEWNITDAFIADKAGNRVVDFQQSNLHVINGSVPVRQKMRFSELKNYLHTLPGHPDWLPYRTVFFQKSWGFCLSQKQFKALERRGDIEYDVCIESSYKDGSLTFAECLLPGESDATVLISTHICHPSLANDGISGIAVATYLAQWLQQQRRRYTYRILFIPATIGAITWLSLNDKDVRQKVRHGLVLSCLGDSGSLHYRKSRRGNTEIDRTVAEVIQRTERACKLLDFEPFGYDQRQFCSPGFDLPMGCLMRTPNECYPEYHTSADDLNLVCPEGLADSLDMLKETCKTLEQNYSPRYINTRPHGEPRLGQSGLYQAFSTRSDAKNLQRAMLWVLNFSDGRHSLRDIAEHSQLSMSLIEHAAEQLETHGFLIKNSSPSGVTSLARGEASVCRPDDAHRGTEERNTLKAEQNNRGKQSNRGEQASDASSVKSASHAVS